MICDLLTEYLLLLDMLFNNAMPAMFIFKGTGKSFGGVKGNKEKVYLTPAIHDGLHHPQTIKSDTLPHELSKTNQITTPGGFATVVWFFLFIYFF